MAAPGIGAAVVVAALLVLGGCGASADDTTCAEYTNMDSEEKTSEIRSLLREHTLDDDDLGNIRSLLRGARSYCGGNPDGKLGGAGDWCSSSWREKEGTSTITCHD